MSERRAPVSYRIAAAVLAAFLLQAGCSAIAGIKPSQETADKFLTLMQAGEGAQAYQLCSTGCKKVASQQDIQSIWDTIEKGRGKVESWTCTATSFYAGTGGNSVTLNYELNGERGQCFMKLVVVPEGDQWLIHGLNYQLGSRSEPGEKSPADAVPSKEKEI